MFKLGTKREPAFISSSRGFTNRKDSTVAFNQYKYLKSGCNRKAVEFHELPKKTGDVGENLSAEHKKRKYLTEKCLGGFFKMLLSFLPGQCLVIAS